MMKIRIPNDTMRPICLTGKLLISTSNPVTELQPRNQYGRRLGRGARRPMIFCDTSAAVKFYSSERESSAVKALFEAENELCLSELARVEVMSVFHRRLREGIWDSANFLSAVSQLSNDDLSGFWTWLPVDKQIIDAAATAFATLPGRVFLRPSDCIHLVTALRHNFDEIYTYDRHQSRAASVLGLRAISIS